MQRPPIKGNRDREGTPTEENRDQEVSPTENRKLENH